MDTGVVYRSRGAHRSNCYRAESAVGICVYVCIGRRDARGCSTVHECYGAVSVFELADFAGVAGLDCGVGRSDYV